MGVSCACQKMESEEETISRILHSMSLSDIEVKCAYSEFLKCINREEDYLDFFIFKSFLTKIIGENNYKFAQFHFFENIRKMDLKKKNVKRIGDMVIYLSKGTTNQKIHTLNQHFLHFYKNSEEKTIKEFIADMIDINTDNCLVSFRDNIGVEGVKLMNDIWKKSRKRKLLLFIYQNYESVKIKYYHRPICSPEGKPIDKLNISLDHENLSGENTNDSNENKEKNAKIMTERNDLCDAYEKFNKSQNEHFLKMNESVVSDNEKIITEFLGLSFTQLSGEYIRNWLYEDYLKDKSYENMCI